MGDVQNNRGISLRTVKDVPYSLVEHLIISINQSLNHLSAVGLC